MAGSVKSQCTRFDRCSLEALMQVRGMDTDVGDGDGSVRPVGVGYRAR